MANVFVVAYTKDGKFELTLGQWWDFDKSKLHREHDKPAVILESGDKFWYINGKMHREHDRPAVTYHNGTKFWYKNGKQHRLNGPAAIYSDKVKSWYIDGKMYRKKEEHNKIIKEALSQSKVMGLTDNREWVRDYYRRLYG